MRLVAAASWYCSLAFLLFHGLGLKAENSAEPPSSFWVLEPEEILRQSATEVLSNRIRQQEEEAATTPSSCGSGVSLKLGSPL